MLYTTRSSNYGYNSLPTKKSNDRQFPSYIIHSPSSSFSSSILLNFPKSPHSFDPGSFPNLTRSRVKPPWSTAAHRRHLRFLLFFKKENKTITFKNEHLRQQQQHQQQKPSIHRRRQPHGATVRRRQARGPGVLGDGVAAEDVAGSYALFFPSPYYTYRKETKKKKDANSLFYTHTQASTSSRANAFRNASPARSRPGMASLTGRSGRAWRTACSDSWMWVMCCCRILAR